MHDPLVKTGLDVLQADGFAALRGRRVGLLCHPASVDGRLRHTARILHEAAGASGFELRALFGPQHGIRGETQDNMVEWRGFTDRDTGLPAFSLYGETRKPTPEMLAGIDTLVIDLQDVGARYYTFVWTMLLCLEACAEQGRRVVVLDRPNPLGGDAREGTILDLPFASFVGLAPIPMRHGLTIGELALWLRVWRGLEIDLEVVRMRGWRRTMAFEETGLPWVLPSPNLPTVDSAWVYPGMCLLEGTELSEGRGTTRPFEIFGAPFIDPDALVRRLGTWRLPGAVFRPLHFQPTFQKHAGALCGGAQIHVTDRSLFRPCLTAVAILCSVHALWPREFRWKQPPYEYEARKPPIDILAGGTGLREAIEAGVAPEEIAAAWEPGILRFGSSLPECLLYD